MDLRRVRVELGCALEAWDRPLVLAILVMDHSLSKLNLGFLSTSTRHLQLVRGSFNHRETGKEGVSVGRSIGQA